MVEVMIAFFVLTAHVVILTVIGVWCASSGKRPYGKCIAILRKLPQIRASKILHVLISMLRLCVTCFRVTLET